MLSKKYPPNNQRPERLSSTWSSLSMAKSIYDKSTRWLIRNGAFINFWYDNWKGSRPLRNSIQGPLNMCESALTVSEVWDHDRNWSLDNLSFVLPRSVSDTIYATPKPFQSDLANLPTWNLSPNGQFNSSTAYALSKNSLTIPLTSTWKWIWKTPTIPRIQTFLWLASQEKIPTKVLLNTRQIVQDDTYPFATPKSKQLFTS